MKDEQRYALAARDYVECRAQLRALRRARRGVSGMPRVQAELREESQFWLLAAQRAKHVMAMVAA